MKKISLKSIANGLSRDELRTIKGGSGGCGQTCYGDYHCAYLGCWGSPTCTGGKCKHNLY